MGAAVKLTILLDTVTDDGAPAVGTRGSQHFNRAFEAIERMRLAVHDDLERVFVIVPASVAFGHGTLLLLYRKMFFSPRFKATLHFHDGKSFLCELQDGGGREI